MSVIHAVILGDLAGQPYEYKFDSDIPEKGNIVIHNSNSKITDDSIMTIAACEYLTQKEKSIEYFFKKHAKENRECGFGKGFKKWIDTPLNTIGNSWGNGSIMRIAPFIINNDLKGMCDAINTSHSHIISLEAGINLYRTYNSKKEDKKNFKLNRFKTLEVKSDITFKTIYKIFNTTESTHEAIKLAVSLGGDTDTNASIVAGLSCYHYDDLSEKDIQYVNSKLTENQRKIISRFEKNLKHKIR